MCIKRAIFREVEGSDVVKLNDNGENLSQTDDDGVASDLARPTQNEAEDAVRTLLKWAGEDPNRQGLIDTPKRVVKSYLEFYDGYKHDPREILSRTFDETGGYDEMVIMRNIRFESHCEHHMAPIIGHAHVAYIPDERVVGISKLARVVEVFAKRLQIQERFTAQIAKAIDDTLKPIGVGVVIDAVHECMTTRGVQKPGVSMVTNFMLGSFRDNPATRAEFMSMIEK